MKPLIALATLALFCTLLTIAQAAAPGDGSSPVIAQKGTHQLTLAQSQVYEQLVVFLTESPLSVSEKNLIRKTVVKGFRETPEKVLTEIEILDWGLREIEQLPDPQRREQIRKELHQNIEKASQQGEDNSLVLLILARLAA